MAGRSARTRSTRARLQGDEGRRTELDELEDAGGTAEPVAHEPRVPRGPGHATAKRSRTTGEGAARERPRSRDRTRVRSATRSGAPAPGTGPATRELDRSSGRPPF